MSDWRALTLYKPCHGRRRLGFLAKRFMASPNSSRPLSHSTLVHESGKARCSSWAQVPPKQCTHCRTPIGSSRWHPDGKALTCSKPWQKLSWQGAMARLQSWSRTTLAACSGQGDMDDQASGSILSPVESMLPSRSLDMGGCNYSLFVFFCLIYIYNAL